MPSRRVRIFIKSIIVVSVVLVAIMGCATPTVPAPSTSIPTPKPALSVLPSPTQPKPTVASSSSVKNNQTPSALDDDVFIWGEEITLERFVELAKKQEIQYVEWFAEPDRLRIFTTAGEKFNYKNERTKLDIPKYMQEQGVKVGEGGLSIEFEI